MKTFREFSTPEVEEEVAANAMSAQAPSAIANPNNRKLFGQAVKRRLKVNDLNKGLERDPGQSEVGRKSEYFTTHRKRQMKLGDGE